MRCIDLIWIAPAFWYQPSHWDAIYVFVWHCRLHCQSLPLEDLPIVGHSDKNTKVMMHADEGIGVDGLKELDPSPSMHDGIHIDGIIEHGPSHIHYELVPPLPVTSNHIISAFQWGHQAFPLVKVKTTNDNTYSHTNPFLPIIRRQIIWYLMHVALFVFHFIFCFVKVLRWWGVTRSTQPHILISMFCLYVISTPLLVTWRVTNVNF